MNIHYKSDLNQSWLIIDGEEMEAENYQLQMLRENDIPGILSMEARCIDGSLQYYYDISGTASLTQNFEHEKLGCQAIKKIVDGLSDTLQTLKRYMLSTEKIIVDPEYIFWKQGQPLFCYYPQCTQNLKAAFHRVTEFFVREVDYRDEEGVHLAYLLHKATMEENYSVEQIMQEFANERNSVSKSGEDEKQPSVSYESSVIREEETERVEEKKSGWEPIEKLKKVIRRTFVVNFLLF